jgi:hypothetical protein
MRRIALPIAISLLAAYGCAASEDSMPAGGSGHPATGGSLGVAGTPAASGTAPVGTGGTASTGGSPGMSGSGPVGTAGTTTGTAGTAPIAGSTGTGGSGPVSGAGKCGKTAASAGMPLLIDDFEDGNGDVMAVDGRMGSWYLATDLTVGATSMPAAGVTMPDATGGMPGHALHLKGAGFKSWGVSLAAALTDGLTGCYDVSKFTGVSVSLKGTGNVYVSVLTAAVRDAPDGMRNHYKKMITLTADWPAAPISIAFTEMTQVGGWGLQVPFDATKIYAIDISPVQATAPATTDYDYWIDNLSFK